ncbi:GIY-YIG nuclease family protein [Dokdonella sp.]|uniref:GIY-YIG nuclease family protein n=1 Tax=Dokdonella sp. TaxID=2291710 RepID=UPI001B162C38|nr:GIY-YIG nuclease family protein [Dokdonella sp.]MBO9662762.1 GIY-YIG nuclease family protein [Dokdonella sp.]
MVGCRDDTLLKIGFTRDPMDRWRTLHPRFFEFFGLDQGILVATEKVGEARALERRLLETFSSDQALAPLAVRATAGGSSEWFRGVMAEAVDAAKDAASRQGWRWQQPDEWMRSMLTARLDVLFAWTSAMLEALEFERHNAPPVASAQAGAVYERALLDTLDAFRSVGLDVDDYVPERVRHWYAVRSRGPDGD